MTKRLKKGQRGEATQYITRSKAIRKLQLNLRDFRRLCILKGIYPRDPKKKKQGPTKSYYHIKDINFLAHEKILPQFRLLQSHMKKYKKALRRGEIKKAEKMMENKPQYTLHHLIKERYPTFSDAIRDLDDPLCLINLFSSFQSHRDFGLPREKILTCMKLQKEFNFYIIRSQSLRKVFLSIKGVYYQAELMGQKVTWLVPYQFPQKLPLEVDYRVMMTFLEFYEVLVKFVNYKLYFNAGLKYPPVELEEADLEHQMVCCYKNMLAEKLSQKTSEEEDKYKISEEFADEFKNADKTNTKLFKKLVFFLNREVPRESLEFVILCFEGEVYWDGDGSNINEDSSKITHFVTDRDPQTLKTKKGREYVQPQWVYDCINSNFLLSIKEYAPGKLLPPHLSPFVEASKDDYIPERAHEIAKQKKEELQEEEGEELEEEAEVVEDEGFDVEKEKKVEKKKKKEQTKEEKELAKSIMPKKNRRILEKINYGKELKKQKKQKLEEKAKKIKEKKKSQKVN